MGGSAVQELVSAAVVLQDNATKLPLAGFKVYGNAYSEGHSHNDAWQNELHVSEACNDADIVVTHHRNRRIMDAVLGCTQPRIWASGHNHEKHGVCEIDKTLFVNASILDKHYRPVLPPVVVDLPRHPIQ